MRAARSLRSLLLLTGLLVSAALAVALVRTKAQQAELVAQTESVIRETTELGQRVERLREEVAGLAEAETAQRVRAAMVLSAVERARRSVGPRVAHLKMQHEANPPPAPLPSPPTPKDGSMGMVFPELMANPEYARCLFVLSRSRLEPVYGRILEALGCDPRTVEAAIDLLTERELLRYEVRSLDPKATGPATGSTEQKLREELEHQLRSLLGETN